MQSIEAKPSVSARINHLDAVRAFALILGIVFHASLSFMPWSAVWAVTDVSTSGIIAGFSVVSHSFRMELFFLIAGFFSCMALEKRTALAFARSRAIRLGVPFLAGWFLLRPFIVATFVAGKQSMMGPIDWQAAFRYGFMDLANMKTWFVGSHLWFLYYLLLLTGLMLVLQAFFSKIPLSRSGYRIIEKVLQSKTGMAWLCMAMTACTWGILHFMQVWGMDTPDKSLIPHLPVAGIYGMFFALGWLLRKSGTLQNLPSSLRILIPLSMVAIGICIALSPIQGDSSHPQYGIARVGFHAAYAVMMWGLVFIALESFRRVAGGESTWIRYIADCSYWMYLIHLPIVIFLQILVAEWPLHWSLKLGLITTTTIGFSVVSYDLIVRSTWLGALLNARKRKRAIFKFI
jgi:glucan biosynthesis protein C